MFFVFAEKKRKKSRQSRRVRPLPVREEQDGQEELPKMQSKKHTVMDGSLREVCVFSVFPVFAREKHCVGLSWLTC